MSNSHYKQQFYQPQNLFFLIIIVLLFSISWTIQMQLPMNWDVAWDLLVTKRVLAGGNYVNDFFDLNPPLIWFLYSPAIFLEHFYNITIGNALAIYIYFLASLSFIFCYNLMGKVFLEENLLYKNILSVVLLIIFFLLPQLDFGEREHFLIIFILPYVLLKIYRVQNTVSNSFNTLLAASIGLFAGMGFAIKPYFLLTPILIEMYNFAKIRNFKKWLNIETIALVVFLIAYIIFVFKYYPNYIYFVVPLSKKFYYPGFSDSWNLVLFTPFILFCYLTITFYFAFYHKNTLKPLSTILLIALMSFLFSYFIQRSNWSYHIYPAFSFAILLTTILYTLFVFQNKNKKILILLIGFLILAAPSIRVHNLYVRGITYKNSVNKLDTFIKQYAYQKPIYILSASGDIIPMINDGNAIYTSRLMHLLWIPGLIKLNWPNLTPPIAQKKDEQFFINMVIEDLVKQKPEYIFVDDREVKPFFSGIAFNYLEYFSKEARFRDIWKEYHYLKTIEGPSYKIIKFIGCNLFVASDLHNINLQQIQTPTVILIGRDNRRTAYFVDNHSFYASSYTKFTHKVQLSQKEEASLPEFGIVKQTPQNKDIVNKIIDKIIQFPSYKLAVYKIEKKQ